MKAGLRWLAVTAADTLQPLLPDFGGACLTGVMPGLLGALYQGSVPPAWMPDTVVGASQVVLLVLDGLGWEQLAARATIAPALHEGVGGPITSVAPSTTACALDLTGDRADASGARGGGVSSGLG